MGKSVRRFRVSEARRITHPVFPSIEKHWFSVPAVALPPNIGTAVNAREPVGLNRRVYRDVRESLEGTTTVPGTFDLMNKGITILADSVKLVDKEKQIYDVTIDDELGGIVDGAHTASIIAESNLDGTTPAEQYVEVYIRTGVDDTIVPDIAKGLNTGMQVAPKSIFNLGNTFDWLKKEIANEPYGAMIAWKESDAFEYDVRDLISILETMNVFDFPNDGGKHPISAYEKWSLPLQKFADDFEANKDDLSNSKYYRLRPILKETLALFDQIRHDFKTIHNENGGAAGKLNIVEAASKSKGAFEFPFSGLSAEEYRLTKGATYPIVAAFRNLVEVDETNGKVQWIGGFKHVLKVWKEAGPELVKETFEATKEVGRNPDTLGKSRPHWDKLHMKVRLRVLIAKLDAQPGSKKGKK